MGEEDEPKRCKMNRPRGIQVDKAGTFCAGVKVHRVRVLRQRATGVPPSSPPHDALLRLRAMVAW